MISAIEKGVASEYSEPLCQNEYPKIEGVTLGGISIRVVSPPRIVTNEELEKSRLLLNGIHYDARRITPPTLWLRY